MKIGELDLRDYGWTVVTDRIGEPVPRLHIVQLYGTDGQRNLSEVPTGKVQYSNRSLTATLEKFIDSRFNRQKEWNVFKEYHGREIEIVMDSDPQSVYRGILNVGAVEQDGTVARIILDINAQPIKTRIVSGIVTGTTTGKSQSFVFDDFGARGDESPCMFEVLPHGANMNVYGGIMKDSNNLFINTYMVETTPALLIMIAGQSVNTYIPATSITTATNAGYKITQNANTSFPMIRFGSGTFASRRMNGLEAGKTYTLRFKAKWKLYSGYTGSSTLRYSAQLNYASANDVDWITLNSPDIGVVEPGVDHSVSEDFVWTFTIPEDATGVNIAIRPRTGTSGYNIAGDYIEVDELMLVEGDKIASTWIPASQDVANSRISVTYDGNTQTKPASEIQIIPENGKTMTVKGMWERELDILWRYTTKDL